MQASHYGLHKQHVFVRGRTDFSTPFVLRPCSCGDYCNYTA